MDPKSRHFDSDVLLHDSNWFPRIFGQMWSRDLQAPTSTLAETDLTFKCPDGSISSHKVLLQMSCQNVAEILSQRSACPCLDDLVTFVVPDFSIRTVQRFLEFLYTGVIQLDTQEDFYELQDFGCNLLGFFNLPAISEADESSYNDLIDEDLPYGANSDHNMRDDEEEEDFLEFDDQDEMQTSSGYELQEGGFYRKQLQNNSGMKARLKCPQCVHVFYNASTLYMHATLVHYRKQLNSMYKADYERFAGVCSIGGEQCNKLKTLQAYLQHMGGKHKIIHKLMTAEVLAEYLKLPIRTYMTSSRQPQKRTEKPRNYVSCILCAESARYFGSISEYKQHLAITHFRTELSETFMGGISHQGETQCSMCAERHDGQKPKLFKYLSLLVHIGSKHNRILDFAAGPLLEQLNGFNVSKQ